MNTQPIELRLADDLEKHVGGNIAYRSAAALRRLHSMNQELVEALEGMINWEVRNLINWDNTAHKNAEAALAKARRME
jgi:hypothetical protein